MKGGRVVSQKLLSTFLVRHGALPKIHQLCVQRLNDCVELHGRLKCMNSISWKDPLNLIVLIKRKLCILTDHRGKVGKWFEILSSRFLLHRLGEQRELLLGSPFRPSKLNFNKWAIHTGCVIFCIHTVIYFVKFTWQIIICHCTINPHFPVLSTEPKKPRV